MADNIKVAIRVRPFIPNELKNTVISQWRIDKNAIFQIDENGQALGDLFTFDRIFKADETNENIYELLVKPFVTATMNGVNSTVFAYGQTSSGKTYTMLGDENNPGIMNLAIADIFKMVEACLDKKFLIRVAYLEIYNEKILDLLGTKKESIQLREIGGSVCLNLCEELVSTPEQVFELLNVGTAKRQFGETKMNERSSRSHTIFKIMVESTEAVDSKDMPIQEATINLVDLAGSERASQTKATGVRLIEGGHINKSLSTLSLVIRQLSEGKEFVNFRDSKLTQILRNSLGGNAKTLIIANITVASVENTHSTLCFAQTAKAIKCKPRINEVLSDAALMKRYASLSDTYKKQLEEQLKANHNLELDNVENAKVISHLRQTIQNLEYFKHSNIDFDRPGTSAMPRRRHTIGYLCGKSLLPIKEDVPLEDETEPEGLEEVACSEIETTPKSILRIRLSALEEEHNQLVSFTRHETSILEENSKIIKDLENKLNFFELQCRKDTDKFNEKINVLNQQLSIKNAEHDLILNQCREKYQQRELELIQQINEMKSEHVQLNSMQTELIQGLSNVKKILDKSSDHHNNCKTIQEGGVMISKARHETEMEECRLVIEKLKENISELNFVVHQLTRQVEQQKMENETFRFGQTATCFSIPPFADPSSLLELVYKNPEKFIDFIHQLCVQVLRTQEAIISATYPEDDFEENSKTRESVREDHSKLKQLFTLSQQQENTLASILPILSNCGNTLEEFIKALCSYTCEKLDSSHQSVIKAYDTVIEIKATETLKDQSRIEDLELKLVSKTKLLEESQANLKQLNLAYAELKTDSIKMKESNEATLLDIEVLRGKLQYKEREIYHLHAELDALKESINQGCSNCTVLDTRIKNQQILHDQEKQELEHKVLTLKETTENQLKELSDKVQFLSDKLKLQINANNVLKSKQKEIVQEHKNNMDEIQKKISLKKNELLKTIKKLSVVLTHFENCLQCKEFEKTILTLKKEQSDNNQQITKMRELMRQEKKTNSKTIQNLSKEKEWQINQLKKDLQKSKDMKKEMTKEMQMFKSSLKNISLFKQRLSIKLEMIRKLFPQLMTAVYDESMQCNKTDPSELLEIRKKMDDLVLKFETVQNLASSRALQIVELKKVHEGVIEKLKDQRNDALRQNDTYKEEILSLKENKSTCYNCTATEEKITHQEDELNKCKIQLKMNLDKYNAMNVELSTKVEEEIMKRKTLEDEIESLQEHINQHEILYKDEIRSLCKTHAETVRLTKNQVKDLTQQLVDFQLKCLSHHVDKTGKDQAAKNSDFVTLLESRNAILEVKVIQLQEQVQTLLSAQTDNTQREEARSVDSSETASLMPTSSTTFQSRESQCSILDENAFLEKYNKLLAKYDCTKEVAIMRKEEIDSLKMQLRDKENVQTN